MQKEGNEIHVDGDEITIALKSKAERNKANGEIVEKLSPYLEHLKIEFVSLQG